MREEMYECCNHISCDKCPMNPVHDNSSKHCKNFLELEGEELREAYKKMKEAAENAKSEE